MNGMWGYKVVDKNYKSATDLIRLLVNTSGNGANLLLNIGHSPMVSSQRWLSTG